MDQIGFQNIFIAYGAALFPDEDYQEQTMPDEKIIRALADQAVSYNDKYFVMDIELWPFDIRKYSTSSVDNAMQKISTIINQPAGIRTTRQ